MAVNRLISSWVATSSSSDLRALEGREPGKPHVEDALGLLFGKLEGANETVSRFLGILRLPYDGDHPIDIVKGHLETFEDVEPVGRLVQLERGPAWSPLPS